MQGKKISNKYFESIIDICFILNPQIINYYEFTVRITAFYEYNLMIYWHRTNNYAYNQ